MRRSFPWGRLLLVLLIALLVVLGWRMMRLIRTVGFVARAEHQVYEKGSYTPSHAELDASLKQLREASGLFPHAPRLDGMYFDTLLLKVYSEPQESDAEIATAIELGRQLLERESSTSELRRQQLAWLYYHAGLSGELVQWHEDYLSTGHASSDTLHFYYTLAGASCDKVGDTLMRFRHGYERIQATPEGAPMAVAAMMALGQPELARPYSFAAANRTLYTPQYLRGMGNYYLEQSSFDSALRYLQQYHEASGESGHSAYELAIPLAQLGGLADPSVAQLLDEAGRSERLSMSRSGVEAQLCARLLTITGESRWWQRIVKLRETEPHDFDIAAALCSAACIAAERRWGTYKEPGKRRRSPGPATAMPIASAEAARQLAVTPRQQQLAEIYMALACAAECSPGSPDSVLLLRSSTHLRRALGDPRDSGSVALEGNAPYLGFLTDHHVRALRRSSPSFDRNVNHAVIDYLNLRRERFASLLDYPPLSYADDGTDLSGGGAIPPNMR